MKKVENAEMRPCSCPLECEIQHRTQDKPTVLTTKNHFTAITQLTKEQKAKPFDSHPDGHVLKKTATHIFRNTNQVTNSTGHKRYI